MPPEFWDSLEHFFHNLDLDQNTPRHKYIIALDEVEKFSAILDEMETSTVKIYAEFENEMQEQLDDLATDMVFRMLIIRKCGDRSYQSDSEEKTMKTRVDEGKSTMSEGEANLVRLEDSLGVIWSTISLLHEALMWVRDFGATLMEFLVGENVDFQVLTNPQIILREGNHPRSYYSLTQEMTLNTLQGLEKITSLVNLVTNRKVELRTPTTYAEHEDPTTESSFGAFNKLPPELQLMILEAAAPDSRIVTWHSKDTINELSATNSLTRDVIQKKYARVMNPLWRAQGTNFPHSTITYVNFETDTVLKSMMVYPSELGVEYVREHTRFTPSIFDVENFMQGPGSFRSRCLRRFTGLSKVKHLALSSVFLDFTPALFPILQVCCPELKTITFCYTDIRLYNRFSSACDIQFLDWDSNYEDYVRLRWDQMENGKYSDSCGIKNNARAWKRNLMAKWNLKASRFRNWNDALRQEFHSYCERYGLDWAPTLRVCLMTHVSADGFRYIFSDGLSDRPGETALRVNGVGYASCLDCLPLTDKEGNFLSRYDGIEDLFREAEE
jgi:hypothetical protein